MWIAEVPCLFRFFLVGEIQRDFVGVFNKTIIPLALVGYEMIIANSAIRVSLRQSLPDENLQVVTWLAETNKGNRTRPAAPSGGGGGWVRAHFPEQRLVIEPINFAEEEKKIFSQSTIYKSFHFISSHSFWLKKKSISKKKKKFISALIQLIRRVKIRKPSVFLKSSFCSLV